jgi:hypothetical protein
VKELSSKLDTTVRLGKTFLAWAAGRLLLLAILISVFIRLNAKKTWKWFDKPHTIRIKKKTIIIGGLILFLFYQFLTPNTVQIVYAGPTNKPNWISSLVNKIPAKVDKLPQTHLEAAQTVQDVPVVQVSAPAPKIQTSTNNVGSVVANCGDNTYANYIYMHESGCSTTITNYLGCVGIGQACPASKLYAVCPNLDYTCENNYFTGYANSVYGGWAGAYSFWVAHSWW